MMAVRALTASQLSRLSQFFQFSTQLSIQFSQLFAQLFTQLFIQLLAQLSTHISTHFSTHQFSDFSFLLCRLGWIQVPRLAPLCPRESSHLAIFPWFGTPQDCNIQVVAHRLRRICTCPPKVCLLNL